MKIKVHLFSLGIFAILFCGCKLGKPGEKNSGYLTYSVDLNSVSHLTLTDIAEFSALVPLETSQNSLIGKIEKVFLIDSLIVVWDSRTHNLLLFNEKGDFKHKIGERGSSPEEYAQITDVCITSDNLVKVLDNSTRRILTFDLDGKHINNKSLRYYLYSFYPTKSGIWGVNSYQNEDNYYLIHISNSTDDIDSGHFPNEVDLMLMSTNHFSKNDISGDVLFHYCYDDNIYKIEGNELNPYILIDFGQQKAPYHYDKTQTLKEKMLSNDYIGRIHNLYTHGEHLFFSFYSHKSMENSISGCHAYISTKTNRVCTYRYDIRHSDEVKISPIPDMVGISNGMIIYQIIPEVLHPNSAETLKSMFPDVENISLESNPILVLYGLKQNL